MGALSTFDLGFWFGAGAALGASATWGVLVVTQKAAGGAVLRLLDRMVRKAISSVYGLWGKR